MQDVLGNLKSLASTASGLVGSLKKADKEVQTDFPTSLLEDYVVKNRKQILKLLGFTNATACGNLGLKQRPTLTSGQSSTSLSFAKSPQRPQTLHLASSWNPLPPNSLRIEKETKKKSKNYSHPLRNLYVSNATHSMDGPPTISVEKCYEESDEDRPNMKQYAALAVKRHSSTGDALEMYRGNLQLQKRLRDLEAKGMHSGTGNTSMGSITSSNGPNGSAQITDF